MLLSDKILKFYNGLVAPTGLPKGIEVMNPYAEHHFFDKLIPLEHPRFIMQYRSKRKQEYIQKYLEALKAARASAN